MNNELDSLIEKRMQTIMIGSLARFEEFFAYLWMENSPDKDYFMNLWQETRQSVLDYGNNQIRLAKKDVKTLQPQSKYYYKYRFDPRRFNNE
jgi:hypothetical protein